MGDKQSKPPALRLRCTSCGAIAAAGCACGVAYTPAGKLAEQAVQANPEKSDRMIAEEIGVAGETVRRARLKSGAANEAPQKRVGKDGKHYSATKTGGTKSKTRKSKPEIKSGVLAEASLGAQLRAADDFLVMGAIETLGSPERLVRCLPPHWMVRIALAILLSFAYLLP